MMISYEEMLKGVRRARETETRIRAMDIDDIVTEIHSLEDQIEMLTKDKEILEGDLNRIDRLAWSVTDHATRAEMKITELLNCIETMAKHTYALTEMGMSFGSAEKYWRNCVPAKYRYLVEDKNNG